MIIVIHIYFLNELYQWQHKQEIIQKNKNKEVVLENCSLFTDCISEINNTQIDNAKYIVAVMPIYNLIEYGDNYSKTSGSLWQYYRDEPALTNGGAISNFHAANNSALFKFEQKKENRCNR